MRSSFLVLIIVKVYLYKGFMIDDINIGSYIFFKVAYEV